MEKDKVLSYIKRYSCGCHFLECKVESIGDRSCNTDYKNHKYHDGSCPTHGSNVHITMYMRYNIFLRDKKIKELTENKFIKFIKRIISK